MGNRRTGVLALALAAGLGLAACTGTDDPPAADPSRSPERTPSPSEGEEPPEVTFGVFGATGEVTTYRSLASEFNVESDVPVRVVSWADRTEASRAVRSGVELPDLFMLTSRDLGWFLERDLNRSVDELLDERGVSFGDDYSLSAINAFAAEDALQCMPWSVSPMVVYYNTDLVDFTQMRLQGIDAPSDSRRWTFDQFAAAARWAAAPRRGIRGVWVEPRLLDLAPFVYSADADVFDDPVAPTTTVFSSDETQTALETTLGLLRNPRLTPTSEQLERRSAVELFAAGRLGMITGFRSLTPELRRAPGLEFDVMPIPTIERAATVGDLVGICLSESTDAAPVAADFLVRLLQEDAVSRVARAGYTVPANVAVASSPAFLQDARMPAGAEVFTANLRYVELPPLISTWYGLEVAVDPYLEQMLSAPVLDLPTVTAEVDEAAREVLDPQPPSTTESPTESPTD